MHARAAETFKKLEDEIKEGALGPQKLAEWKRDEAEWIGKVVNMEEHKDLKNPYEPRQEKSESAQPNSYSLGSTNIDLPQS